MFDYSDRIESFRDQKVRLPSDFEGKLLAHRKANRDRLISRLPGQISGVSIGESSFKPQGSFAMQTVIQTRFTDEEYDIDDGVVLWKHQLVNKDGEELTAMAVKEKVREALKDARFNRQPRLGSNCVRVFYADEDEEKHHVDFPIYRKWEKDDGDTERELASEDEWVKSDPTQVNVWFGDLVKDRNKATEGWGTQFRQQVQLLKRFCRSRPNTEWDMPKHFTCFRCSLHRNILECAGEITPSINCDTYRIAIRYPLNGIPRVKIRHPEIPKRVHMYRDGSLCLYDYREQPWSTAYNIHETIIPWTAEWLVFYELYLLCGKWLGPEAQHGAEGKEPEKALAA